MSAPAAYGSLDDLVTATLADFARCGIDSSFKLSLLESAWNSPVLGGTVDQYTLVLGRAATRDGVRAHLEQLVALGLLVREGDSALPTARYRLTDSPLQRQTLSRLFDAWSHPALRARAAAQLRSRMA
ncbi:MAG: hypothetical protein JO250_06060 [Armatimonadetes bacterium]|nr:hypothetical protein [Armatimonadota bacterium]